MRQAFVGLEPRKIRGDGERWRFRTVPLKEHGRLRHLRIPHAVAIRLTVHAMFTQAAIGEAVVPCERFLGPMPCSLFSDKVPQHALLDLGGALDTVLLGERVVWEVTLDTHAASEEHIEGVASFTVMPAEPVHGSIQAALRTLAESRSPDLTISLDEHLRCARRDEARRVAEWLRKEEADSADPRFGGLWADAIEKEFLR